MKELFKNPVNALQGFLIFVSVIASSNPIQAEPKLPQKKRLSIPISAESNQNPVEFRIKKFAFKGNTVFTDRQLQAVVSSYLDRKISFSQLLEVRGKITKFYIDRGYITSEAFLPLNENQEVQATEGKFTIQIIEGKLEGINISGSRRLQKYVRSRLRKATSPVLNSDRLLQALQLLQLDPLVERISADLSQGSGLGKSFLNVQIEANKEFWVEVFADNSRSPGIGSFQRGIALKHTNLLGLGDKLSIGYKNTEGSNAYSTAYSVPINPKNGTIEFLYANISSNIIEEPFSDLDIIGNGRVYEISWRQPLINEVKENSTSEFALGITASRQETESSLLDTPYPLSRGADDNGKTRISGIRFFQEWSSKGEQEVFSVRSQFSIGVGVFGATINNDDPDSRFFSWRGQGAWFSKIGGSDTSLSVKTNLQISDKSLVPLEQFSLGNAGTVRGYRRDIFLTDNGFSLSTELRLPVSKGETSKFYVIPFADLGIAWNNGDIEEVNRPQQVEGTLASLGLGVEYQIGQRFNARLDWGVPLIEIENSKSDSSWQEQGLNFSVRYQPF